MLKIPGIVAAQRFRRTDIQRGTAPHPWSYLAIYECETDDISQIVNEINVRSGTPELSLTSAAATERLVCFFEPITDVLERSR